MSTGKENTHDQIFSQYPDVVTVLQLSEMLNICPKSAYQLLHEDKIAHFRTGRIYRIPKISVLKYMSVEV